MSVLKSLLQLLYPIRCVSCRTFDTVLCLDCIEEHTQVLWQELYIDDGLIGVVSLGPYGDPFWRVAVEQLKFNGVRAMGIPLGHALAGVLSAAGVGELSEGGDPPIVLPIPLHKARMRERGYNQSAIIAEALCQGTGWPLADGLLTRAHATQAQSSLEQHERSANVNGVFTLHPTDAALLRDRTIIVIDDVITTGATVSAAIQTISEAAPAHILVATAAYG